MITASTEAPTMHPRHTYKVKGYHGLCTPVVWNKLKQGAGALIGEAMEMKTEFRLNGFREVIEADKAVRSS